MNNEHVKRMYAHEMRAGLVHSIICVFLNFDIVNLYWILRAFSYGYVEMGILIIIFFLLIWKYAREGRARCTFLGECVRNLSRI